MAGVSVRSCLGDLLAPTRGSHRGLEADNACRPLQYLPWRMCGTLRKLYPRVGCRLSATRGGREEHWSVFAFTDSVHCETVQDKKGTKGSMH